MEPQAIGTTKGPGQSPHDFTFVSPDAAQSLRTGEYVAYQTRVDGQPRRILARITERQPLRLFPDSFMANPAIAPDTIAAMIGHDQPAGEHELFQLTATILGYYDAQLGDFINPRIPPRAGWPVYLAEAEELKTVLSAKQPGYIGAAHIGSLLSRERDAVPVVVDVQAFTSTHLAIIASTGAGKSYLAGVLLEELLKPYNRAAVLIVDPHGEYNTLTEVANLPPFTLDNYRAKARIFQPGEVKVRRGALTMADLRYLLPNLTERMEYILRRAYNDVQRRAAREKNDGERWTLGELMVRLRQLGEGSDDGDEADNRYKETAEAIIWRLESVLNQSVIFDDFDHLKLDQLFKPGQCSVLQLNEVDERQQQVMVATLLRRLFRARIATKKNEANPGDELYLPYPIFVLLEEAHHFAPAGGEAISTGILKQILGEGRKFGVGVGLISQRPGKLDGDVLSQCNTQFLLRIVNPVDQARVAESVETVGRDLLRELPALTKGQVIIAGQAVNTPILCRVRSRHTTHGAESINAPAEWVNYTSETESQRRSRDTALPASAGVRDDLRDWLG
ncbi:MAG: hypothetical protein FOGNACKC_06208 [Anaerolineae bacterium]|nr:hypothetical protein [Anaerolineae bacterium]